MSYVAETLSNLLHQTAFFNLTVGKLPDDSGSLRFPVPGNPQRV